VHAGGESARPITVSERRTVIAIRKTEEFRTQRSTAARQRRDDRSPTFASASSQNDMFNFPLPAVRISSADRFCTLMMRKLLAFV
jgi:hypothetical protein